MASSTPRRRFRRLLPWLFVVASVVVVVSLWSTAENAGRQRVRQDADLTANHVRIRLEAWITSRIGAVRLFADQYPIRRATGVPHRLMAERTVALYPGFQALNFVDEEGVIRVVVPTAGNEAALNKDLWKHPDPAIPRALQRALDLEGLSAGPVIDLLQGGRGLTMYHPVYGTGGELEGFINGVFRVDHLVDMCLAEAPLRTNYYFRLREKNNGRIVYRHPMDDSNVSWQRAVADEVKFLNHTWQLELAPTAAHAAELETAADEILALVGLVLILLISLLMISHFRGLDRLADSQKRYRLLVENVVDMIVKVDAQGRFLYVSPRYCRTFGKSEADLLDRSFMPVVHEDDRASTALEMEKLAVPPHTCYIEQRALTANGWRWLSWSATAIVDDNGATLEIIYVGRDITERKELEEQLLQSQKLEALGRLAGGIAHDFNNILQAILGNLSVAKDDLAEDHPVRQELESVERSALRAGNLTQQLLTFGRRQPLEHRPVDVNRLVEEHRQLVKRIIGEGVELEVRPGSSTGHVLGDRSQLEQVLMNLSVNARDAVGADGRIVIATDEQSLAVSPPGSDLAPGRYVTITVEDDGEGMNEETLDRIFDPFYTTKEQGRGTGLGLATVHGIVNQHRGQVVVESSPGVGTSFTVWLPCTDAVPVEAPMEDRPGVEQGHGRTVLLAEDDSAVRDFASRTLTGAGYQVLAARDGREAVARAESVDGGIDLALLDVVMPNMDGPTAARRLRELYPDIVLVFSSGYAPDESLLEDPRLAGARFLSKPYQVRVLLALLAETGR